MSHYVIITPDDGTTTDHTTRYRASCKCGWFQDPVKANEVGFCAQRHLAQHNAETHAYDYRSAALQSDS